MAMNTAAKLQKLFDKRLSKVFDGSDFKAIKKTIPELYNVIGDDSAFTEYWSVSGLPDLQEFNGKIPYVGYEPGYSVKIEPKEFALGTVTERKLLDDKQFGVLDDRARDLADATDRYMEKVAVRPFAYAFSSAFDFMQSEEGVSLASSSHTTKASGVSTTSGFGNAGTSAMSKTSVAATRILMRKFRDMLGERIDMEPDTIICPDNLVDKAMEIVGTEKGLDSAEGTINVQHGRYKIIPLMRWDDVDTNDWAMVDYKKMKKFLMWINRIKPEFKTTVDFETYAVKNAVYARFGNGFRDWRWCYFHQVT